MSVLLFSQYSLYQDCLCLYCYLVSTVFSQYCLCQYCYLVSTVYVSCIIYSVLFMSILLFVQYCSCQYHYLVSFVI